MGIQNSQTAIVIFLSLDKYPSNMKKLPFLLLVISGLMLQAFRNAPAIVGTYGVGADDPAAISLTLLEDHSFSYQDRSVAAHQIYVAGKWEVHNGKIILKANGPTADFHDTWHISDEGRVAKSRKGMTFYTLRRQ